MKYRHDLSDEAVVPGWVEDPCRQHFSGRQYFEHEFPIDPSSMTRWRKRLGEAGAEAMLKATIEAGVAMGFIWPAQVRNVNVDTMVQTKDVLHPTDARLDSPGLFKNRHASAKNCHVHGMPGCVIIITIYSSTS